MMDDSETLESSLESSQWRVDRFVRQFGPEYRFLVQVAAVPIVLTPELVGYLRGQFLPRLSWVAEADLLLSELCRSVGYERYVMDSGVQAVALQELESENPERVEEIARLLVGYMRHLARVNPYLTDRQRKHQQWAAMLCVSELREEAIGQIVLEFETYAGAIAQPGSFGAGRSEIAFLNQVLQEQLPRLLENSEYLKLATQVSQALGRINAPIEVIEIVVESSTTISIEVLEPTIVPGFPPLQYFEFETGTIEEHEPDQTSVPEVETPVLEWRNQQFEFETATIEVVESTEDLDEELKEQEERWANIDEQELILAQKYGWGRIRSRTQTEVVINESKGKAVGYVDRMSPTVKFNMIAIPSGKFLMGAPEEELNSDSDERPQHWVTVPEFWMGQSPVTQTQWRAVAELPQVKMELKENPSRFQGVNLPVEQVSWDETIEFCDRLSIATGRTYCLPSEAQWEYACRAGTTTPFYFGETIDAELANYDAKDKRHGRYGRGRWGEYQEKTMPVGNFPANGYGLYDMHGNVWEWCADDWHGNYEGVPTDSSVWKNASNDSGSGPGSNPRKVVRGGSWFNDPRRCRSASRNDHAVGSRFGNCGFRVVVVVPSVFPGYKN